MRRRNVRPPFFKNRQGKTNCSVSAPTCRETGVSSWGRRHFGIFAKIRLTKFKLFDIITNVSGGSYAAAYCGIV